MELNSIGGGLMIALAAALWLVYLVPNWLKNREYRATERNAVRLQQTIRVLAQTSELPQEVRAETAARRAAELAKFRALSGPVAVGRAVTRPTRDQVLALSARRLRRTRAFTSLVLLASLVVVGVQFSLLVSAAIAGAAFVAGTWLVLAAATAAAISASSMLSKLAERSRVRQGHMSPAVGAAEQRRRVVLSDDRRARESTAHTSWTPVPVPQPMYLTRSKAPYATTAPEVRASIDAELRRAAESAERALRVTAAAQAAEASPQEQERADSPAPTERPATRATPAATSRFAGMGIIDVNGDSLDLNAALARRRAS